MTILIIAIVIAVLLLLLWMFMGYRFMTFAFLRKDSIPSALMPKEGDTDAERSRAGIIRENRKAFNLLVESWLKETTSEDLTAESKDGLKLHGLLISAPKKTHRYVILCHGYLGSHKWMLPHAYMYQKWGYNSLVLDMRSHGGSEGRWIGMGWLDKDDIQVWIDEILYRDPYAKIVLQGISMGGATVMMASGLKLPSNVKAIVADCGYTSVWDVFFEEMSGMNGVPTKPVLSSASFMNRAINGWTLKEASSVEMLKKADPNLPILFIQGEDDDFVHVHMIEENFNAKRGLREKRIFSDTDHGNSYVRWPEEYFQTVKEFTDRYVE